MDAGVGRYVTSEGGASARPEQGRSGLGPRPGRSFGGDGRLYRLAAEAERLRLAPLFDPYLVGRRLPHGRGRGDAVRSAAMGSRGW